jgi:hypothetical protein
LSIIIETILGLIFIFGVICIVGWFLFREQFLRAWKYFKLWSDQDEKREAQETKLRERLAVQQQEVELSAAAARERAEAEVDELEGRNHP